jgi:hypothetical protein
MKRFLLLPLLLTLAAPAQAARFVGTWITGDNVRVLSLSVRDNNNVGWGTSVGKGYVPSLEIKAANDTILLTSVAGVWSDSTETEALFSPGIITSLYPTSGHADYDFLLYMTKPGYVAKIAADDNAEPFRFRLQRYP